MAAKEPASDLEGSPSTDAVSELPLPSLEESLLSMEKLDRASPELWPEQIDMTSVNSKFERIEREMSDDVQISPSAPPRDVVAERPQEALVTESNPSCLVPGVSEFAPMQSPTDPPAWKRSLTVDDISYMQKLDALTTSGLIVEVKKLHDLAYKLGTEEAKEMTRGKYLNIFAHRRPR